MLYPGKRLVNNNGTLTANGKLLINFSLLSSMQKMVAGELFSAETTRKILPDAQRISRTMHVGQKQTITEFLIQRKITRWLIAVVLSLPLT
jgi:hypothetical protein